MRRVRVVVSGRVQGVGFRWICAQEAKAAGVGGFVRNLPDGRVEAVFEGPGEAVARLVEWVREGPEWARVERVETEDEAPVGDEQFRILR